ncbi:hypothetical protein V5O48_009184, partial [Marasmius crinis-equi]
MRELSMVALASGMPPLARRDSMLALPMAAPLDVLLGMGARKFSSEDLRLILPEVSRFRQLHINIDNWSGHTDSLLETLSVVQSGAPNLTSLTIIPRVVATNGPNLPNIFCGNMPALRQLTLSVFSIWPSHYFHNLTHLCLFYQVYSARLTTAAFLDFLESSPRLRELALVDAGPTLMSVHDCPQVPPKRRSVKLSYLKELVVGRWPVAGTERRFLTHLSLPTTTNVHIYGRMPEPPSDWQGWQNGVPPTAGVPPPAPPGPGAIGPGLPTTPNIPVLKEEDNLHGITSFLPLNFSPIQTITKLSLNRTFHAFTPHGVLPHYTIRKSELYVVDQYTNMDIRSLVLVPAMQQITTLVIRDGTHRAVFQGEWGSGGQSIEAITTETWGVVFESMTNLKTLQILQHGNWDVLPSTREILKALFPRSTTTEREVTTVPCPALETILLQGLYPIFRPGFIVALAKARHEQNYPLRSIEIHFKNNMISVEQAHDPSDPD